MRGSGSFFFRQADTQVGRLIDGFAIGLQPAVGRAEHKAATHDGA